MARLHTQPLATLIAGDTVMSQPVAETLVKEVAKPAKDAMTEVVRSGDFLSYTAEEGVRFLGEGNLLASDSFPGQDRTKLALVQKVGCSRFWRGPL